MDSGAFTGYLPKLPVDRTGVHFRLIPTPVLLPRYTIRDKACETPYPFRDENPRVLGLLSFCNPQQAQGDTLPALHPVPEGLHREDRAGHVITWSH